MLQNPSFAKGCRSPNKTRLPLHKPPDARESMMSIRANANDRPASPVGTRDIIWLLSLSIVLVSTLLPFSSYVAAMPFIKEEWGLNNTQAGAIFSAYLAGYAVAALLVLPLTDRLPVTRVFMASAITTVSANVLFPLVAQDIVTASLLRAAAGGGLVGLYMPGLRMISERFADSGKGAAMGMYVTAFYSASAISLASTGALMSRFEWRDAFLILAAISAVNIPLAYMVTAGRDISRGARSTGRLNVRVIRNKRARANILAYSLHAMELYAVRVWLPGLFMAVLVASGEDPADAAVKAATVAGIALAFGSVGPLMGGAMSDRWGRARTAAGIFALSGACSWAIGWIGGVPWPVLVGVAVVYGWAISADSSIYSTAVTESASSGDLGSMMAMQAFLGFMGGVVGPILIGGVLDVFPDTIDWGMGFSAIGMLAVIAIPVLLRTGDPTNEALTEEESAPG